MKMRSAYITLAWGTDFNVSANEQTADHSIRFHGVDAWSKRQNGAFLGGCKLHLCQVVDEEVQLCGHAAKTGLDQPRTEKTIEVRVLFFTEN